MTAGDSECLALIPTHPVAARGDARNASQEQREIKGLPKNVDLRAKGKKSLFP